MARVTSVIGVKPFGSIKCCRRFCPHPSPPPWSAGEGIFGEGDFSHRCETIRFDEMLSQVLPPTLALPRGARGRGFFRCDVVDHYKVFNFASMASNNCSFNAALTGIHQASFNFNRRHFTASFSVISIGASSGKSEIT